MRDTTPSTYLRHGWGWLRQIDVGIGGASNEMIFSSAVNAILDYKPKYTEEELIKDWNKLVEWKSSGNTINSTSRIGMKLCEHFFPNFYDIEDNKGNSFNSLWEDVELLKKVIRWNRKSHSTPYLSELRRGIYFCGKLCKSTMYRPQMSKMVTQGSENVLDPCAGWVGKIGRAHV